MCGCAGDVVGDVEFSVPSSLIYLNVHCDHHLTRGVSVWLCKQLPNFFATLFHVDSRHACLWLFISTICILQPASIVLPTVHTEASAMLRSVSEMKRVFQASRRLQQELRREVRCNHACYTCICTVYVIPHGGH